MDLTGNRHKPATEPTALLVVMLSSWQMNESHPVREATGYTSVPAGAWLSSAGASRSRSPAPRASGVPGPPGATVECVGPGLASGSGRRPGVHRDRRLRVSLPAEPLREVLGVLRSPDPRRDLRERGRASEGPGRRGALAPLRARARGRGVRAAGRLGAHPLGAVGPARLPH